MSSILTDGSMPYKDPEAQRAYQRRWIAARRAQWFEGRVCEWCGASEKLELDHLDPDQKLSHCIWSWSWARILEEVAKCRVLCQRCHQYQRHGIPLRKHGTVVRYDKGCRCDACREAKRIKNKRQRDARKA